MPSQNQLINDSDSSSTLTSLPPPRAPHSTSSASTATLQPTASAPASTPRAVTSQTVPLRSPCFVHSFLDKGASLTDWLRNERPHQQQQQQGDMMSVQRPLDVLPGVGAVSGAPFSRGASYSAPQNQAYMPPNTHAHPISPTSTGSNSSSGHLGPHHHPHQYVSAQHAVLPLPHSPHSPGSSPGSEFDDEEDGANNLTRQLAATAVGVREMSKQLGKCDIHLRVYMETHVSRRAPLPRSGSAMCTTVSVP